MSKMCKSHVHTSEDSNQPAYPHSLRIALVLCLKKLDHWQPIERLLRTLIRRRGGTG